MSIITQVATLKRKIILSGLKQSERLYRRVIFRCRPPRYAPSRCSGATWDACSEGVAPKDDFTTGPAVAPVGGTATVLVLPNTAPPLVTPAILEKSLRKAQPAIDGDVGLFALEKIQINEEKKC